MTRIALITATLILGLASVLAGAQESSRLPDIGSSAGGLLPPAKQHEYGQLTLSQLRHYEYTLDDPLLGGWLQGVGNRLAAVSDKPQQSFTFFWLKDRQINAFATLGGYIAMNAGLVLAAEDEGEMASVLSHEIAHVTQSHVLRSAERAQKDSIPILLAMLGAIALAQSGGDSSQNAAMAAMASAQGLAVQRQIDYTRANEAEADRIGIRTLATAGYDPLSAAQMFTRMQTAFRSNRGGDRERAPDYLQTHPITSTRIAEAKQRAEELNKQTMVASSSTPGGTSNERVPRPGSPASIANNASATASNPLLPANLRLDNALSRGESGLFAMARERLRVLSANTPDAAVREYEQLRHAGDLDTAQQYGLALARLRAGQAGAAMAGLAPLLQASPGEVWLTLAMAESEARAGKAAAADARMGALLERFPRNRAIALTYAGILAERNTVEAGGRAQAILRPLLASAGDDPIFQATFARANEIAGDPVRAGEAYAEADYLNGSPERALLQLNTLKRRPDLDYYARARIDARIAAITPTVLELKRQGIRDEDLEHR